MSNNNFKTGRLVFVDDDFFDLVQEPYLKVNKGKGAQRPHYFAFKMNGQKDMYWVAPLTSRIAKFDEIVAKKQAQGKPTDIFFKTQVRDKDAYILFADMFPVNAKYLRAYNRDKRPMEIDPRDNSKALKEARKVVTLLEKGVKFTRTSPDVKRITKVQIEHEKELKVERENDVMKKLQDFVEKYNIKMSDNEQNQGRKM